MTTPQSFAILRADSLIASRTNPRTIFDDDWIDELGASILDHGVVQPILVRPLPAERLADTAHLKPRPTHEIVMGECRWRGTVRVKVEDIPCIIRDLTDKQVLVIQIIENLKRKDLTDLETAEGYHKLMQLNSLSIDEVVKEIGKSRSYLYGSLKLLDLPPNCKQALRCKSITSSAALLIARVPDLALQGKALAFAEQADDNGHKPSIRAFQQWLRDNVMLDLSKATFSIIATDLTAAESCTNCDKRTGANPDLFADVKSADVCTHPPCYHLKAEAHKANLAAMIKSKPPEPNRNVDEQQGLGLVSTLAQDARHDPVRQNNADIATIKAGTAVAIDKASRIACCDELLTVIYEASDDRALELLKPALLRAWLLRTFDYWQNEDIATAFDLPPLGEKADADATTEFTEQCRLRIQRAPDADLYRYVTALMLIDDREQWTRSSEHIKPATLFDAFAEDWGVDLAPVRKEAADQVEAEMKAKIATLNKQIKATKTTFTPPPAGAASDAAAADAKTKKPTALPRKAKTTAQEATAGIAAAMQGIEPEPLDASLGGSEAATACDGKLSVGAKVKILDGKHSGKEAIVKIEVGDNMWSVEVGNMFSVYLPTKSLEVIA
jgi:ParB/RepB/Spo0J family partition protein